MGKRLEEFYQEAQRIGSIKGRMRLAIITLVPSSKASEINDSPEIINKFTLAMEELKKEFIK